MQIEYEAAEKTSNLSDSQFGILSAITHGGPVGIFVMVLLIILSIATWGVILERWLNQRKTRKDSERFLKMFWDAKSLSELHTRSKDIAYSPAREVFRSGYNEMVRVVQARDKNAAASAASTGAVGAVGAATPGATVGTGSVTFDTVKRALSKARMVEESHLNKSMSFLAISASACPFIGLFGTVVGIIRAFQDIASAGSSSLAAVAPGISEALIATALGLAAAIPAVIFYNALGSKIKKHLIIIDGFASDFLNIMERHFNVAKANVAVSQTANTQNTDV
jgi:biopolymer transport protein TolQ